MQTLMRTAFVGAAALAASIGAGAEPAVHHKTIEVDGVEIFYREAGPADAPTIILLHGFPTSSRMFRDLAPALAENYHVLAPDMPGFGHSESPSPNEFEYTFANLSATIEKWIEQVGVERYTLYVMDYGAPVGFRIAERHPERVEALLVQNGNAYDEGLEEFWNPIRAYWTDPTTEHRNALRSLLTIEATRWQYTHGARDIERLDPDIWAIDQAFLDRPGNAEIQLDLFYDYRTNVPLYPAWQAYLREHQPPTLIVWGRNDFIFPPAGAYPYLRDLPDAELHMLDTGHFALEEDGDRIAAMILEFMGRHVPAQP